MIDVQVVRENIALELREKFIGIASSFRRIVIEQGNHLRQIGFVPDRPVLYVGKMFGQKIDNAITKLPHLVARKRDARSVSRGFLFLLFQLRQEKLDRMDRINRIGRKTKSP